MKTRLTLIRTLHVSCIICEMATAVGLAAVLLMAPFSEALVRSAWANVGFYAGHGSLDWSFRIRLPYGDHSSLGNDGGGPGVRYHSSETAGPSPGYGKVSFGPLRLRMEKIAFPIPTGDIRDPAVSIDDVEGTMTLMRPELAAQAVASAKWPFVVSMLCSGGVGLAILDLLRRMLRSASQREVFAAANIRYVQLVGFL
ncbi:MAG TPA: hypothetical protein VKG78_12435, partial [Opitutaceae bacterium]|nr:hypothetical protein [Opitutaceae bacterium]